MSYQRCLSWFMLQGCKILVMKDKVICLSDVMSVKLIITTVIYSLQKSSSSYAKENTVSFSLTNNSNVRLITRQCKMNVFPKIYIRTWNFYTERTMPVLSSSKNNFIFLFWLIQQRQFWLPKECDSLAAHIFQTKDGEKAAFNKPLADGEYV